MALKTFCGTLEIRHVKPTPSRNRWGFPDLGIGVGLRTVHYPHILEKRPRVDFFEVLSENYMDTGGRPAKLFRFRRAVFAERAITGSKLPIAT